MPTIERPDEGRGAIGTSPARLARMIQWLREYLSEALDAELKTKMSYYIAANELLMKDEWPQGEAHLRATAALLALEMLGVGSIMIERHKMMLNADPNLEYLVRRQ